MIYDLANFNLVGENSTTTAGLKGIYIKEALGKILVIKLVRTATRAGLKEAKVFVESIIDGNTGNPYPDLQYPFLLCYTTESDENIKASLAADDRDKIEIVPLTGTDIIPVPTVDYKNSETLVVRQSSDKAKLPVPYSYVNAKTGAGNGEILLSETTKTFTVPESGYVGWHKFTVSHAPVQAVHTESITSSLNETIQITPSAGFGAMSEVNLVLTTYQDYEVDPGFASLAAGQSVQFLLQSDWSIVNLKGQILVADNTSIRLDFAITGFNNVEDYDAVEEYTLLKVFDLQAGDYTGRYWLARFSTDSDQNATITLIQEITTPAA